MKFDFFIKNVHFKFAVHGKGNVRLIFNGKRIKNFRISKNIKKINTVQIIFSKENPADVKSFAVLERVDINGFNCVEKFKTLSYKIDRSKHNVKNAIINNNLYFGYVGSMTFQLEHTNDLLSQAAWILANNEFNPVKWPKKGNNFQIKDLETVSSNAKFMFTGVHNLQIQKIQNAFENKTIKELRKPLKLTESRLQLENWMKKSKRFKLRNLEKFKNFTLTLGVHESLQSFINRATTLHIPGKSFEGNGEMLEQKNIKVLGLNENKFYPASSVLLEIPAPWYNTKKLLELIDKAKKQKCKIAVDATWLCMSNEKIDIDLNDVDEFYFSMNKAWPLGDDLRPGFRWSRDKINDASTFSTVNCSYPKLGFQIFFDLIKKFSIDWVYNSYRKDAKTLIKTFDLENTNILWFAKNKQKNQKNTIGPHYDLDEFVSLVNLLKFKNKYFW